MASEPGPEQVTGAKAALKLGDKCHQGQKRTS